MYLIKETTTAAKDLKKIKSKSPSVKNRLVAILRQLQENPYADAYGNEELKYEYSGFRSMELTKKDRVVFAILEEEKVIEIHGYLGHYSDK